MPDRHSMVEFRQVSDFPFHRVGTDGTIWTCLDQGGRGPTHHWRQLVAKPSPRLRYVQVALCHKGKVTMRSLHRIVLEAFRGPCPPGMEACHNDGDPFNNRLDNLRWDTRKGNFADEERHGTKMRGERHHQAKLTENDVREIRRLREQGVFFKELAKRFGISLGVAHAICSRKIWRHVQ
jgi:HNH endonuclease